MSSGDTDASEKDAVGFLNRWSVRKQQVLKEATDTDSVQTFTAESKRASEGSDPTLDSNPDLADRPPQPHSAESGDECESVLAAEAEPEQESVELTDADMPAIDTLTSQSDLSGFFSKGVSATLRRSALRFVFQQPQYNVRDGLNDYDGDYTVFEPLGDTVTADMKFHAARKERERIEAEQRAAELAEQEEQQKEAEMLEQEQQAEDAQLAESEQQTEDANPAEQAELEQAELEQESELRQDKQSVDTQLSDRSGQSPLEEAIAETEHLLENDKKTEMPT
ncbi:MAG: DUF3306 domain-containing protein [Granulosicoccus sp.]